ncbi:MAG: DUF309 domain-containing protein [Rhodococcus sp. (in: high G+C Gram-positive bacteria)]
MTGQEWYEQRERDVQGRPQNARPRDGLGRPLPRGSDGVERIPDDLRLPPAESLVRAQQLLDDGMPFHAHEILEGTWKISAVDERELWQGLAQLAVGLTHVLRGNRTGAATVLARGRDRLRGYVDSCPHAIDAAGLIAWADDLLDTVHRDETPDPIVPRLTV